MTDPSAPGERTSVAALLVQRSRADRRALLDDLVAMLEGVVPGAQADRSLLRRQVTALRVPVGDFVYVLSRGPHDALDASRRHVVRGVAIRTVPLEIGAFLEELGVALDAELRRTEEGCAALQRWLGAADR